MQSPLLEFDKVSKNYGTEKRNIQALRDASFSIQPGEAVGVIGESGAGKTTLAAIAAGITQPSSGNVLLDGERLLRNRSSRLENARMIQLVWQDVSGSVDPRMTAGAIVAEPLSIHRLTGRSETVEKVAELLQEVGLSGDLADRYPHELSGGELQRIVIARALSLNPRLLICDEPASALDASSKMKVADLLMRLQAERNLALMLIAHDLDLVSAITRRLLVVEKGVIHEEDYQ